MSRPHHDHPLILRERPLDRHEGNTNSRQCRNCRDAGVDLRRAKQCGHVLAVQQHIQASPVRYRGRPDRDRARVDQHREPHLIGRAQSEPLREQRHRPVEHDPYQGTRRRGGRPDERRRLFSRWPPDRRLRPRSAAHAQSIGFSSACLAWSVISLCSHSPVRPPLVPAASRAPSTRFPISGHVWLRLGAILRALRSLPERIGRRLGAAGPNSDRSLDALLGGLFLSRGASASIRVDCSPGVRSRHSPIRKPAIEIGPILARRKSLDLDPRDVHDRRTRWKMPS